MSVNVACPNCDARLEAPDDIVGKKVKCRKCGEKFRAQYVEKVDEDDRAARRAAKAASKSDPRPAASDEDEDERPSRRSDRKSRRREEDDEAGRDRDEDRPRRPSPDEEDEEDEPRERKKKGKKKKKAGRPVVLLILIGVGVLLLVSGIGIYFSFSRDNSDGSAAPSGPVSGPGADGGSAGDPALPGWSEFADPNGQFKVRVPRTPAGPAKQLWPLPNGDAAEAAIYSVEIGGGLYSVAHLIVPGREAGAPADPLLDEVIGGGTGWFKGAVIKSQTKITHQGFPGRQAVLEYPGVKGSTTLRVILAGNRMFWVLAKGDNTAADPKIRGFLDSLKIN
jgi:hypothetical protein